MRTVSVEASQDSCRESGGELTCDLGSLGNRGIASVRIAVTTTSAGSILNTASVVADEFDPDGSNNSDSEGTEVRTEPLPGTPRPVTLGALTYTITVESGPGEDTDVTLTTSPGPAFVGSDLDYTLTLTNNGASKLKKMVMTVTLPAAVEFVSASINRPGAATSVPRTFSFSTPAPDRRAGCDEAGGTITCDLGDLKVRESVAVTITVRPTEAGILGNRATMTAEEIGPILEPVTASEATIILSATDLVVTKSGPAARGVVGDRLIYRIGITNRGPSHATGVVLTDTMPAGVRIESMDASQGGCVVVGDNVVCELGYLLRGDDTTVTIAIITTEAGAISNTARAVANELDSNESNNAATFDVVVSPAADLALTLSGSPDPVPVGGELVFTLKVTNAGPSAATGVVLEDDLPEGVEFISASPMCEETGGTVVCEIGSLATGSVVDITIVVIPASAGRLNNTARVAGNEGDPNATDDVATAQGVALCPPYSTPPPLDFIYRLTRLLYGFRFMWFSPWYQFGRVSTGVSARLTTSISPSHHAATQFALTFQKSCG